MIYNDLINKKMKTLTVKSATSKLNKLTVKSESDLIYTFTHLLAGNLNPDKLTISNSDGNYSPIAKLVWSYLKYTECDINGEHTTLIEAKEIWEMINALEFHIHDELMRLKKLARIFSESELNKEPNSTLSNDELRRELSEFVKGIRDYNINVKFWAHTIDQHLSHRNGKANQLSEVGKVMEPERENQKRIRIFNVTFRGKDERGEIIKGIDVVAESSEQAMDLIRQVSASNEIYSPLQVWNECEQEKSHLKNDEPKQGTSLKCGCGGNLVWTEYGYVCDVCG